MTTIFTQILNGDLPGRFVARTPTVAAFLTIAPITPGHLLVVPVDEVDQWTDLSPERSGELMGMAHVLGGALKEAFDAPRAGLIVAGFEVPHAHVHVFPAWDMADFDFAKADPGTPGEELAANQQRILDVLARRGTSF
jgi:histidine triad (HIT) family protein